MEENVVTIKGEEIKESDLTPEQHHHKNHVISLRNKIANLHFEIDDLMPSLKFHEQALIKTTKKQADGDDESTPDVDETVRAKKASTAGDK